ncbi:hypothetical protein Tsubulata_010085 [Turnera subulata]|uniref:Uncharacterized protein n=1 Tax=Turnera subulata TaxID=218843 RepID=A0A9Q0F8H9_9ROSI|nr:hypothetical protein Tsubulata_010085 [Turnera subulata]
MEKRKQPGLRRGLKRHNPRGEADLTRNKHTKRNRNLRHSAYEELPADVFRKRQRQRDGESDAEEDELEISETTSLSGEEDSGKEGGIVNDIEAVELDDDQLASETDQEQKLVMNVQSTVEASISNSSFHAHLGQNLSEEEIESLSQKKWKYKWDVPALDMADCKWIGTGECFLKGDDLEVQA